MKNSPHGGNEGLNILKTYGVFEWGMQAINATHTKFRAVHTPFSFWPLTYSELSRYHILASKTYWYIAVPRYQAY